MKDLRDEVGTNACIVGKIVKCRVKWAGHMVRMKYDKLPKRSEGCRKRGRPQLRWEDCVKTGPKKAEEEEKWREKANNTDQWKQITKVAVLRRDQYTIPTPTLGTTAEEQYIQNTTKYNNDYFVLHLFAVTGWMAWEDMTWIPCVCFVIVITLKHFLTLR